MLYRVSILILFFSLTGKAQTITGKNFAINIGVHIAAGTHFDRIGISCNGYFIHNTFQLNYGAKAYYNFKNIGPSKKYFEVTPSLGILFSFGKIDSTANLFIDPVGNQTLKRNSIGYALNYYLNNIKTSQATGTISFQFGSIQFICEDDVFAGGIRDEFRTGGGILQYRNKNFRYGLSFVGWTGKRGLHIDDPAYPSRNGYMDMSRSLYGNISAGLMAANIQYITTWGQVFQGSMGIDGERVRNFYQNKLVHRVFFSPKKGRWRGGSDLPMIDTEGKMYLYRKDQKVRPARLFINLFTDPNLLY